MPFVVSYFIVIKYSKQYFKYYAATEKLTEVLMCKVSIIRDFSGLSYDITSVMNYTSSVLMLVYHRQKYIITPHTSNIR